MIESIFNNPETFVKGNYEFELEGETITLKSNLGSLIRIEKIIEMSLIDFLSTGMTKGIDLTTEKIIKILSEGLRTGGVKSDKRIDEILFNLSLSDYQILVTNYLMTTLFSKEQFEGINSAMNGESASEKKD